MQNIDINMFVKFHDDRSKNDEALGDGKSDNKNNPDKNNNNKNNVRGHWGTVSGSNKMNTGRSLRPIWSRLERLATSIAYTQSIISSPPDRARPH